MSRRSHAVVVLAAVAVLAVGGNGSVRSFGWPASDGQRLAVAPHRSVILPTSRPVPRWGGDTTDDRDLAK